MGRVLETIGRVPARIRRCRRLAPALFRARALLGLVLLGLLVWVVTGDPDSGIPEREAAGVWVRPKDYWRTIGWYLALVNAGGVALLIATARRWVGRGRAAGIASLAPPAPPGRAVAAGVLLAVVLGASLAAPRLDQSFWDDEDRNLRQSIIGSWVPDGDGGYRLRELSLLDSLRSYHDPNNHVVHSLLAHASIRLWQLSTGADEPFVSEIATRLPAFLAGLGALGAVAGLLWRVGYPISGALAALLLAIHPWWIRYASEARGYSLGMALIPLGLLLLARALHRGTWGRWLAFAGAQLLLVWVLPNLLVHAGLATLAAAVLLWQHHGRTPAFAQQASRLAIASVLAAQAFVQLMGPNLAQIGEYLERTAGTRDLGLPFLVQTGSYLLAGTPWMLPGESDRVYPQLHAMAAAHPILFDALLATSLTALLVGSLRLLRAGALPAWLPAIFLLTPLLCYAVGRIQHAALYYWYLVFALPGLAALAAVGLGGLVHVAERRVPRLAAAALIVGGFLALDAWLTQPERDVIRARPFRPAREAVALTRPVLHPLAPENERIITARIADRKVYYDPRLRKIDDSRDLVRLMAEADATGKRLYVNTGRVRSARRHRPEVFALLDDPSRFTVVAELPAVEPPWARVVWHYRPRETR